MANQELKKITRRETFIVLGLYLLFFVWWYATAYGFGGDPSEYKYVFGFPQWFFYSCIVGYVLISLLLWIVVKMFFADISFDEGEKKNG